MCTDAGRRRLGQGQIVMWLVCGGFGVLRYPRSVKMVPVVTATSAKEMVVQMEKALG
ncbi:MAG: hypothetical protein WEE67_06060 [Chloroflexota bacterium]